MAGGKWHVRERLNFDRTRSADLFYEIAAGPLMSVDTFRPEAFARGVYHAVRAAIERRGEPLIIGERFEAKAEVVS